MAVLSKTYLQDPGNLKCTELIHPWTESCVKGNLTFLYSSIKGFFFFYILMHGVQILFSIKHKKKLYIKQILFNFVRSVTFGVSYSTLFVFMNCLFQKILGKFNNVIFVYAIPFFCGLPIFMETPERRSITMTTFLSMCLESFYRVLISRKFIVRSKKFETLLFMLVNGFLMYSLRMRQELRNKKDTLWFFTPALRRSEYISENITQSNKQECPHQYSCLENIIRDTVKYSSIGLVMAAVRFLVYKIMSGSKSKESFFNWRSLRLTFFMSSYVSIFGAVNCSLCKLTGRNDYFHTFWSGFLSGISYWFNPNLQIMFTAATMLLKIQGESLKKKYKLPNFSYSELTFLLSNMFLLQRIVFDFQCVPTFFYNILIFATSKKASIVIDAIHRLYQF